MSTFITTFIACIITAVVVFFFSRWMFKKELKKNKLVSKFYIYGQNDGITIAELKK